MIWYEAETHKNNFKIRGIEKWELRAKIGLCFRSFHRSFSAPELFTLAQQIPFKAFAYRYREMLTVFGFKLDLTRNTFYVQAFYE